MSMNHPFLSEKLGHLLERALQYARRAGADAAEAVLSQERGFTVTARMGEVESLEHQQGNSVAVTVYDQHRMASASTTDLSITAIKKAVEKALAFARHANKDPDFGLADPDRLATTIPDLSLYHPWDITPEQAIETAIHCEEIGRQQDKRIICSEGVDLSTFKSIRVYANTHGFMGCYPKSYHSLSCGLVAKEKDEMQRDYEYTAARDPQDLQDPILVAKQAAEKTLLRLGAQKIKTQHCPVIFHAPIAKSLLSAFVQATSGRVLRQKASFLFDHLNQAIFPEHVHLYQRPHLLKGIGSAPFDQEGVKTEDRDYVIEGILSSYFLSSYSARKLGLQTTGNAGGPFNLFISHSDCSLEKLLRNMGSGFLVTELIGQGVNILTGDYSRGAAGFWVEQGKIQTAVHEVTVAGNLKEMLKNLVAVGNDIDHRGNIQTGSIWLDRMMIAGE